MEDDVTINLDLGLVPCGQKTFETVKIKNKTKETQVLVVDKTKKKVDLLEWRLRIHPTEVTVQPGHTANFTLTYLSFTENLTDNYVYEILELENIAARLKVRAKTFGPSLDPKIYKLKFFWLQNVRQVVKNLEIFNKVQCESKFCFAMDENFPHLEISQICGIIPSGTKVAFKFTFKPTEPGTYYKTIFCLVQYHEPLVFKVYGIYNPTLKFEPKNLKFKVPLEVQFPNNFEAYMANVMKDEKLQEMKKNQSLEKQGEESEGSTNESSEDHMCWTKPIRSPFEVKVIPPKEPLLTPVLLTTSFFDMKNSKQALDATVLFNFEDSISYCFQWDRDPENNFQIDPYRGVIEPKTKVCFAVYFTPSLPNSLHHFEADLKIFPCKKKSISSTKVIDLPRTLNLVLIGHSFTDDNCGWVPQCKIVPKTLHLGSCVPGEIVYGGFVIERHGHLPVNFMAVPPKESNYEIQPPLGHLSKNFQLFVVRFWTDSKEEKVYSEDLKFIFNHLESNFETIKLVTSVEVPKLLFGKNNSVTFTPIVPDTQISVVVPIKNPTNLHISYEFKTPEDIDWAAVVNPKGVIEPRACGEVEVVFKPEKPCEYLDYISCEVSSVSKPDYIETIYLQIKGSSQYGYLVATPSLYDFGECIYLQKKEKKIYLFNFSAVLLRFQLVTVFRAYPTGDPEKDVKVSPDRGSVPAKSFLEVTVTVTPHKLDEYQFSILCQRIQNDTEEIVVNEEPTEIFIFRFEGVLPTFQIIDLNVSGGGPLFSPHWLWKMLQINRINKMLSSVSQKKAIEVRLPEAMMGSPPITIGLLVQNNRHGEVSWTTKQKIDCTCSEGSEKGSFCEHSNIISFNPLKNKLNPKQTSLIQIIVRYNHVNPATFEWVIKMPPNRTLTLSGKVTCLPTNDCSFVSMFLETTYYMKPVFIGDLQPPLQLFWLYNNSQELTSYIVDKLTLREATPGLHRIFDCVNPNGVIPPFSCAPLLFMFRPIEIKTYSVEVLLCICEESCQTLHLIGDGVAYLPRFQDLTLDKTIPYKPLIHDPNVGLECSANVINIYFLREFSQISRVFILKNKSETEAWAFQWHTFKVDNIIYAKVEPKKGIIEPGKSLLMTLLIKSFCCSTSLSISIPCDVINYSLLRVYESSVRYAEMMSKVSTNYFTITEKGTTRDKPTFTTTPKPEANHIFITVNTNIINNIFIDQKLTYQQQSILRAENEIQSRRYGDFYLTPSALLSMQFLLEKVLWDVLYSTNVVESIAKLKDSQSYCYLQMKHSEKRTKENVRRFFSMPSKTHIQSYLENTIRDVIYKTYNVDLSEKEVSTKTEDEK